MPPLKKRPSARRRPRSRGRRAQRGSRSRTRSRSRSRSPSSAGSSRGSASTGDSRRRSTSSTSGTTGTAGTTPRPSPTTTPGSSPRRPASPSERQREGSGPWSPARDATIEKPCPRPRCSWRGTALWSHWSLAHGGALIGGRHTLDTPVRSATKGLARGVALTRLLRTRGRLFALQLRRRPGEAGLQGCVQLLGSRPSGRVFLYQIQVLDGSDPPRTSVLSQVTVAAETPVGGALRTLCDVPSQDGDADSGLRPSTADNSLRIKVSLKESPFDGRRGGS